MNLLADLQKALMDEFDAWEQTDEFVAEGPGEVLGALGGDDDIEQHSLSTYGAGSVLVLTRGDRRAFVDGNAVTIWRRK